MTINTPDLPTEASVSLSELENFVLVVSRYEVEASPPKVIGIRADTGEEVEVSLRDEAYDGKSIEDLAKPLRKQGVEAGGAILVETAQFNAAEGSQRPSYTSRWITVLTHTAEEAGILMGHVHLRLHAGSNGNPSAAATILIEHEDQFKGLPPRAARALLTDGGPLGGLPLPLPRQVYSLKELEGSIEDLLNLNYGAHVRVTDFDQQRIDVVHLYSSQRDRAGQPTDARQVAQRAMRETLVPALSSAEKAGNLGPQGNVLVEVLPSRTIFLGAATLKGALGGVGVLRKTFARYTDAYAPEGSREASLYIPSVLAVRPHDTDDKRRSPGFVNCFLTAVYPLLDQNAPVPLRGIDEAVILAQTAAFQPEIPQENIALRERLLRMYSSHPEQPPANAAPPVSPAADPVEELAHVQPDQSSYAYADVNLPAPMAGEFYDPGQVGYPEEDPVAALSQMTGTPNYEEPPELKAELASQGWDDEAGYIPPGAYLADSAFDPAPAPAPAPAATKPPMPAPAPAVRVPPAAHPPEPVMARGPAPTALQPSPRLRRASALGMPEMQPPAAGMTPQATEKPAGMRSRAPGRGG